MNTPPAMAAAALATELAYLVDLPVGMRGEAESARYDQVRWAVGALEVGQRMAYYAAAVAAIDPDHALGTYPDPNAVNLTVELYAFETWRLTRLYHSDEPTSDAARRLLVVTDPLLHTYSPQARHAYSTVNMLLTYRDISADDFPNFSLRDYLSSRDVDLEAWDASAQRWADIEEAVASGSLDFLGPRRGAHHE